MNKLILILVILLVALQYRLWFGDGSLQHVQRLQREIDLNRTDLERIHERNTTLEAEVDDLKTGLEAVEERARSDLGMIRKGETYYQIVGTSSDQEASRSESSGRIVRFQTNH